MARVLLLPLSWIFLCLVMLRRWLYAHEYLSSYQLGVPVVSVGNVVIGGTGKSVVVGLLAARFLAKGRGVAILMRGYRGGLSSGQWQVLRGGRVIAGADVTPSDEAAMHSAEHPDVAVVCGANRVAAWRAWMDSPSWRKPDVVILDDGMQHLKIRRDLEVVASDVSRPSGSGRLLPAGDLREPMQTMSSASLVIAMCGETAVPEQTEEFVQQMRMFGCKAEVLVLRAKTAPPEPVASGTPWSISHNQSPLVVVGIANPKRFLDGLRHVGVSTDFVLTFEDHGEISPDLLNRQVAGRSAVVTTSKDYWRSPNLFANLKIPVFVAPLRTELPAELLRTLDQVIANLPRYS